MSDFKDVFVPNIQSANKTSYTQWKQSNPKEAAAWESYRDAVIAHDANPTGTSPVPPSLATKYGKALVAAGKLQVSVTDIGAEYNPTPPPEPPPDPPPAGNPHFTDTFSLGKYAGVTNPGDPWVLMFSYSPDAANPSNGFLSLNGRSDINHSGDRRIAIVKDPAGSGAWVSRHEIRDSDPGWPSDTTVRRAQVRSDTPQTLNGSFASALGKDLWMGISYYLPYGVSGTVAGVDGFAYPRGTFDWTSDWNSMWGFHSESNGIGNIQLSYYKGSNPASIIARYDSRSSFSGNANLTSSVSMFQVTNADGSRYMPNFNRWIRDVRGTRLTSNGANGGFMEFWLDGVLRSRVNNVASVATNESGIYFDFTQYTSLASHASGGTVCYFKDIRIGFAQADVM